jgi:hypothetical protein
MTTTMTDPPPRSKMTTTLMTTTNEMTTEMMTATMRMTTMRMTTTAKMVGAMMIERVPSDAGARALEIGAVLATIASSAVVPADLGHRAEQAVRTSADLDADLDQASDLRTDREGNGFKRIGDAPDETMVADRACAEMIAPIAAAGQVPDTAMLDGVLGMTIFVGAVGPVADPTPNVGAGHGLNLHVTDVAAAVIVDRIDVRKVAGAMVVARPLARQIDNSPGEHLAAAPMDRVHSAVLVDLVRTDLIAAQTVVAVRTVRTEDPGLVVVPDRKGSDQKVLEVADRKVHRRDLPRSSRVASE